MRRFSLAVSPESFLLSTRVANLFLLPADRNLTGAEIEMVTLPEREHRLKRIVDPLRAALRSRLHRLPAVSWTCSRSMRWLPPMPCSIPLHCEYFALEGLADLVGTMRRVRGGLNPSLEIDGVLLTMYDDRTNLGQLVARDVREFFKEKVFNTIIPRNVKLGEAPSHGMPAALYDAKSRGAAAYAALAKEVLARHAA